MTDLYGRAGGEAAARSRRCRSTRQHSSQCRGQARRRRPGGSTSAASSPSSGITRRRSVAVERRPRRPALAGGVLDDRRAGLPHAYRETVADGAATPSPSTSPARAAALDAARMGTAGRCGRAPPIADHRRRLSDDTAWRLLRSRCGRAASPPRCSRPGSAMITIGASRLEHGAGPRRVLTAEADVDAAGEVRGGELARGRACRASARRRRCSASTWSSVSGFSSRASASSSVGRSWLFSTAS